MTPKTWMEYQEKLIRTSLRKTNATRVLLEVLIAAGLIGVGFLFGQLCGCDSLPQSAAPADAVQVQPQDAGARDMMPQAEALPDLARSMDLADLAEAPRDLARAAADLAAPVRDMTQAPDLARAPDLAPTCGASGAACSSSAQCCDGSFAAVIASDGHACVYGACCVYFHWTNACRNGIDGEQQCWDCGAGVQCNAVCK